MDEALEQKLPQHVAIIMDGNGRWAENKGLLRIEGHRAGIQSVKAVVEACLQNRISVLSLFAFSSENWARPVEEVNCLMDLFIKALENEMQVLHENGVQLRFSGDASQLSPQLRTQMKAASALTAQNQKLHLNIVVNYSGQWDILQAAKRLAQCITEGELQLDQVNTALFSQLLDTQGLPDPDLLIRTSGEQRLSNFFLWQLAYTELYFTEVLWPDFTMQEFHKALQDFSIRERRFGQTTQQVLCLDND